MIGYLCRWFFESRQLFARILTVFVVAEPAQLSAWEPTIKLTAADAAAGDIFGYSTAISGKTAIIGAHQHSDAGQYSGSAYVFDFVVGSQIAKLTAADAAAGDRFGQSVAISRNIAVVGAPNDNHSGVSSAGSAYLFNVTTGQQLAKLTAPDAAGSDLFGTSVAISGNTAIVGSVFDDHVGGTDAGSAYLFDATTATSWLSSQRPTPLSVTGSAPPWR
jgi:hypothetical protein